MNSGISGVSGATIASRRPRRKSPAAPPPPPQQRELHFNVLAETAPVMIWTSGLDKGCDYFNQSWLTFTGRPLAKELGNGWTENVHPDDLRRCMSTYINSFDARQPFSMEYRLRRADGQYRWILDNGMPRYDSSGRFMGYMGSCIDITENRQATQNLHRVVECMPNAVVQTDSRGNILLVNAKTENLFGYRRSDLIGKPLEILVPKRYRAAHVLDRKQFGAYPTARPMGAGRDLFALHKDGHEIPVEIGLTPIETEEGMQVIAAIIDLSERRSSEDKLVRSREFNRAVLLSLRGQIAILDSQGNILTTNDAWSGWVREHNSVGLVNGIPGENYRRYLEARSGSGDLFAVEALAGMDAIMAETRDNVTVEMLDASNDLQWFRLEIVRLQRPEGGMVVSQVNISEQKRAQLEVQDSRLELAHMRRVSTIGELAASIAHELNQPLTAILSNAQAALRFLSLEPVDLHEVKDILKDVVADDKRAGEVIRRLRVLLKRKEPELGPLQINTVVSEVESLLRSDAILRKASIQLELDPDLPMIYGDDVQLQQVLMNLVLNGLDAMMDTPPDEKIILIRTSRDGSNLVQVTVRDRGHGIGKYQLERIFTPFFTTKKEGLGMGLAVTHSIIEAHKGRLWAENNPDKGAVFYFTLPVYHPSSDGEKS